MAACVASSCVRTKTRCISTTMAARRVLLSEAPNVSKKLPLRKRKVISEPSLTATLKTLEPGDYVQLGNRWSYGTVRQTASMLRMSISTKRNDKGIVAIRMFEIPEPV